MQSRPALSVRPDIISKRHRRMSVTEVRVANDPTERLGLYISKDPGFVCTRCSLTNCHPLQPAPYASADMLGPWKRINTLL